MAKKKYTFYAETDWVPRYWYLHECLTWIAFNKIPFGYDSGLHSIETFNHDRVFELGPEFSKSHLMHLDRNYTDKVGISPSPMTGKFSNTFVDELKKNLEEQKSFLKHESGLSKEYRQQEIDETEDFMWKRNVWIKELNAFLDVATTKLFLALHEGRVKAHGIAIPAPDLDSAKRYIERHSTRYSLERKIEIPAQTWNLANADWNDGTLSTEGKFYCCVGLFYQDLLSEFKPNFESAVNGGNIDGLILTRSGAGILPDEKTEISKNLKKTGRPSKNWDQFHLEITRRIINGELPKKQTAAIVDMQVWFENTLGETVGTSTIAEKLKPYYDAFIKPNSGK